MKTVSTQTGGLEQAVKLSAKGKKYSMTPQVLDQKVVFDFICDLLDVAPNERKTRREIVKEIMYHFPCTIGQAYRYYNEYLFKFEEANVFDKHFLQTYIIEESMDAIHKLYEETEFDGKAAAALLKNIAMVRKDWVDKVVELEPLPIPVYVGDPRKLPQYDASIESKLEGVLKMLEGKKGAKITFDKFEEVKEEEEEDDGLANELKNLFGLEDDEDGRQE